MSEFSITTHTDGNGRVVHIVGDVDHATAPELSRVAHDLLTEGVPTLVFDVTEVPFLDSAGMSAFVRAHLKSKAFGTRVIIRGAGSAVRRALQVAGISELVEVTT